MIFQNIEYIYIYIYITADVCRRVPKRLNADLKYPQNDHKMSDSKIRSSFRRHGRFSMRVINVILALLVYNPTQDDVGSGNRKDIWSNFAGQRSSQPATPCRALRPVSRHAAAGVARPQGPEGVHHL